MKRHFRNTLFVILLSFRIRNIIFFMNADHQTRY